MLVEALGVLEALAVAAALALGGGAAAIRHARRKDPRNAIELREHYVVERELADRLRAASSAERARLYGEVYDELFRRVAHHPQLAARRSPGFARRRQRNIEREWRLARRFLPAAGGVFMEVGAGDCAMSLLAARSAGRVIAVDVSEQITAGAARPANLELRLTDGTSIPAADGSVHLAFSSQLMEHLHPDDAAEQLAGIARSLAPGGVYVCITPSRINGPHDVSRHFDERATGLHLREYSARELRALLLASGFRAVRFYAGARGWYVRVPYALLACAEAVLEALPGRLRRRIAGLGPVRALLGLRVAAIR